MKTEVRNDGQTVSIETLGVLRAIAKVDGVQLKGVRKAVLTWEAGTLPTLVLELNALDTSTTVTEQDIAEFRKIEKQNKKGKNI